jgi:hypothetical protein
MQKKWKQGASRVASSDAAAIRTAGSELERPNLRISVVNFVL